jgi:GT2 family glycosyltransferase
MIEKPVAIILPCHNSGKYIQIAIDALINRTQYPFKLILIESESTDGTAEVCDFYADTNKDIIVYHTKKEGLVKAINYGIQMAEDLDVYLMQDDIIVPRLFERDWLAELVKASKEKDCGIVVTLNAGGISGPDYINGLFWAGTWSTFIPRSTINKIGLFDENFSPGCGDDIDYSYRIYKDGLRLYMTDFWVEHHRKTEHFNQSEELKKEHAKLFRKKWKLGEFKDE